MAPGPEGAPLLRLGVFGGTFDPPHIGHVSVARDAADALALDRVLWIPALDPPHKPGVPVTAGAIRWEMVQAACAADPRFQAWDGELRRPGPSYTVDTLRALRALHPDALLFLLMGADQARELDTWKDPEEVLRLATPALMDRDGASALVGIPPVAGIEGAVAVPVRRVDVSATGVRGAVARGEDVSGLLLPEVLAVVIREGLYGR